MKILSHCNISCIGGDITDDGGASVISRGVVWSTSEYPTIDDNEGSTADQSGEAQFVSNLAGLTPGTTYYVRAYATNSKGTAYGNQVQFISSELSTGRDFNTKILDGYHITAIAFDNAGNVWIGTLQQGLVKYNSGEVTIFNASNSTIAESSAIWDLAVDSKDNIWCGDRGTYAVYNGEEWFIDSSSFSGGAIFAIEQSPDNRIWIGTGNGIYKSDTK